MHRNVKNPLRPHDLKIAKGAFALAGGIPRPHENAEAAVDQAHYGKALQYIEKAECLVFQAVVHAVGHYAQRE
jgi:hypothetical protein